MPTRHDSTHDSRQAPTPAPARVFAWSRNDALVAVGAAAVDLTGYSLGVTGEGRTLTVPALGLLVAAGLCLVFRRRHPLGALAAVLALGVLLNLTTPLIPHFGAALAVALYSVARFGSGRVAAAAAAATVPLSLLGHSGDGSGPDSWLWGLLGNTVAALLCAGTGAAVRRRAREAEAHRTLLADRAVAEERRRIARELHDIVAHHITTMQLMAGGARANLTHDPGAAREALITLEDSGRIALREMRQLLDVLRAAGDEPDREGAPPEPQPGAGDLDRLVTESRLAGTETGFTVDGPVRALPPSVGLTVFRIVQEALTNARRHAGQARIHVRLTYRPAEVRVEVRNDRAEPAPAPAPGSGSGSGYGLIGMRERVALQGGTLEAGAVDGGGFRVAARIPADAAGDRGRAGGAEEVRHR
ncbi:sensor histidine kinase [Streptomyces sp. NPDC090445]|uniref:sensor histidine kinase n=1 Tax=Streptomyces sp. NPDC090445 TaxID=3365963 RepID=UPI003827D735